MPFSYEIGLGFSLNDVVLTAGGDGITVELPLVRMTYDSFEVTGDPKIKDFWYSLSQARYQKMLDAQAAECRAGYMESDEVMDGARQEAETQLAALFKSWSGSTLPLKFIDKTEN